MSVALVGFLALRADPAVPPPPLSGSAVAALHNPHTARSVLAIDGYPIGEVGPRGCVTIRGLVAGAHQVVWTAPSGFARAQTIEVP